MRQLEHYPSDERERHECFSERKDNWVIFRCPQCEYVRWMNWETGEMKVREGDFMVLHSGMHYPVGIDPNTNMN